MVKEELLLLNGSPANTWRERGLVGLGRSTAGGHSEVRRASDAQRGSNYFNVSFIFCYECFYHFLMGNLADVYLLLLLCVVFPQNKSDAKRVKQAN